ncbi:MAG: phosphoribosylamine--glycine ligase [Magnetococcales bacterium]|nr:phosphoribosylamine--glycine ligase [Magnetococcales bacterium]
MKILVVGSGGREHALVWKIAQSPLVQQVYCAPGNAGIASVARCVPIQSNDIDGLTSFVTHEKIDLTVIGPELPLVMGLVDRLKAAGQAVFGPSRLAAYLEGSKVFMKDLCDRYDIPTAGYRVFHDAEAAKAYTRTQEVPIVIKASGLASGKGVMVCQTLPAAIDAIDEIMTRRVFGAAGDSVVIEEFLTGEEASFLALVDGTQVLPLASCQDHKAVGEGDTGPNTGGMGAYSPAPVLTDDLCRMVMDQVMLPTVQALAAEGRPYRGVLYAGLMIDGPRVKVLEFNTRFGDPETQPLLVRMKSDIVPLLMAAAVGSLAGMTIDWDPRAALCVVMASGGYPTSYDTGLPIGGLEQASALEDVQLFHAGTARKRDQIVTHGGRVMGVTALAHTIGAAKQRAYQAVRMIHWSRAYYRRDIGYRAIAREME